MEERWLELLIESMAEHGEGLGDIISSTLSEEEMRQEFIPNSPGGKPFTVWTEKSVYFPVIYDNSEWVGRVSRNPDGIPTKHMGNC